MFPETFTTERLRCRRLATDTVDPYELYEYTGTDAFDRVARYLTTDSHDTVADAQEFLAESEEKWAKHQRADWAIHPRDGEGGEDGAGAFAGVASLIPLWDRRTARLGIWLREPFWGRGYSGERAAALIRLSFERLDLDVVTAGCVAGNERSRRAIENYVDRFGGSYDGVLRNWVPIDGEALDLHRYTITAEEYAESDPTVRMEVTDARE